MRLALSGIAFILMLFTGSPQAPPQAAPPQTQTLTADQSTDLVAPATMVAVTGKSSPGFDLSQHEEQEAKSVSHSVHGLGSAFNGPNKIQGYGAVEQKYAENINYTV